MCETQHSTCFRKPRGPPPLPSRLPPARSSLRFSRATAGASHPAALPGAPPVRTHPLQWPGHRQRCSDPETQPPRPGCKAVSSRPMQFSSQHFQETRAPVPSWERLARSRLGPLPRPSLQLGVLPFCLMKPHFHEAQLNPSSSLSEGSGQEGHRGALRGMLPLVSQRAGRCPPCRQWWQPGHPLCRARSICAPHPFRGQRLAQNGCR